jgi:hypothetical protein
MDNWPEDFSRCPRCGFIGDLDSFDVLQACDGCVFCQQCGTEFYFDTGKEHTVCKECEDLDWQQFRLERS